MLLKEGTWIQRHKYSWMKPYYKFMNNCIRRLVGVDNTCRVTHDMPMVG